jgi:hypothetical protein
MEVLTALDGAVFFWIKSVMRVSFDYINFN